jgi:hypothetical protein
MYLRLQSTYTPILHPLLPLRGNARRIRGNIGRTAIDVGIALKPNALHDKEAK